MARLEARSRSEWVSPFAMAVAYLGSGGVDRAFDSFEEGAEIHDFLMPYIRRVASARLGIAENWPAPDTFRKTTASPVT